MKCDFKLILNDPAISWKQSKANLKIIHINFLVVKTNWTQFILRHLNFKQIYK